MACIPLPGPLPEISLPDPLSIGVTLPTFSFDPALCCKLLPFPLATPPIPLPPAVLQLGIGDALVNAARTVNAALALLKVKCPRE